MSYNNDTVGFKIRPNGFLDINLSSTELFLKLHFTYEPFCSQNIIFQLPYWCIYWYRDLITVIILVSYIVRIFLYKRECHIWLFRDYQTICNLSYSFSHHKEILNVKETEENCSSGFVKSANKLFLKSYEDQFLNCIIM